MRPLPLPAWCHCPSTLGGSGGPSLARSCLGGWEMWDPGPSSSLLLPGARLRNVCFLFPVGDSPFTLLLSLLAWLS